jgi:hypothetical protein
MTYQQTAHRTSERRLQDHVQGATEPPIDAGFARVVALIPAVHDGDCTRISGFNILLGDSLDRIDLAAAESLDIFVLPEQADRVCREIARLSDSESRPLSGDAAMLSQAPRLRSLRARIEERIGYPLPPAGRVCGAA